MRLRGRIPGEEVATLIASIEPSRSLGSPLADQLGRQAIALRRDQRRAVEEKPPAPPRRSSWSSRLSSSRLSS
jgi:pilus assembly protein TadC